MGDRAASGRPEVRDIQTARSDGAQLHLPCGIGVVRKPGAAQRPKFGRSRLRRSGGAFQLGRGIQGAESRQAELDALVVVVADVIMHARFERLNAVGVGRGKPEALG